MKKLKNYEIAPMMTICAGVCAIYVQESLYLLIPMVLFFVMGIRKKKL